MNNNIKFSIMTPVYKVEQYLPECIESVLGQTYGNFEFILVDDGSPDHSGEICDEYAKKDSRIRVFHKPNGGLMHTRRYALERAQGDYYVFLDSDDYLSLDTLETLSRYISETGVDCVIYGFEWLRPEGTSHIKCSSYDCGRVITDKRELYNIVFNDEAYNSLCRKCAKASCFDGRDHSARYHIRNGEDLVHARRADNYAAVQRDRAADKAGARAARGNGDEVLIAELHDRRDLFGALHLAYRFGEAFAVDGHFVVAVVLGNATVKIESVLTDYRLELFGELSGDLVVFRHAFISLKYFYPYANPGVRDAVCTVFKRRSLSVSIP